MARDVGTASFSLGTGSKSINLGRTATDMRIVFKGSGINPSEGYIAGGYQYAFYDNNATADSTKAIRVRNTSGTTILEGTWTSFSGNYANFNITTQTGAVPQMLLDFGY